jgi:predicted phosphodiesterase
MITEEIVQEVLRIRNESPRTTFRQLAEQLLGNPDYAALLRKYISDQQKTSEVAVATREKRKVIPDAESPYSQLNTQVLPQFQMELPRKPRVDVSSAIILADLHCPHVDAGLIEAIMRDSHNSKIDTIILAGDIIDGQFTGRHKNPPQYVAPAKDELNYMRHYLKFFERNFNDVYVMPGNHDGWVTDYFEMSFQELIDYMLGDHGIYVSPYEYLLVNDNLVVGHLEEWNEVPGFLAWKIANQFKRHAIVGHDHIRGVYTQNHSPYYGVSLGASLVPENIYYKQASFNSFPEFQRGYAVLTDKNTLRTMAWDGTSTYVDKILHI